jgi:hypothetical protein
VKIMARTKILRRAFKLKLKGKRPMGQPRTRWLRHVLQDIKKRGKKWQEIEKERL